MTQSIEQRHQIEIDSLAAAIHESLYYFRKICDKSSSKTLKARATIEHCISFEHCDVEIEINFKAKKNTIDSSSCCSESSNDSKISLKIPKRSPLKNKTNLNSNDSESSVNAGLIDPQFNSTPIKKSKKEMEKEKMLYNLFGSDSEGKSERPNEILRETPKIKKVKNSTTRKPYGKSFHCSKCPRRFSWEKSLVRHQKNAHNELQIQAASIIDVKSEINSAKVKIL